MLPVGQIVLRTWESEITTRNQSCPNYSNHLKIVHVASLKDLLYVTYFSTPFLFFSPLNTNNNVPFPIYDFRSLVKKKPGKRIKYVTLSFFGIGYYLGVF